MLKQYEEVINDINKNDKWSIEHFSDYHKDYNVVKWAVGFSERLANCNNLGDEKKSTIIIETFKKLTKRDTGEHMNICLYQLSEIFSSIEEKTIREKIVMELIFHFVKNEDFLNFRFIHGSVMVLDSNSKDSYFIDNLKDFILYIIKDMLKKSHYSEGLAKRSKSDITIILKMFYDWVYQNESEMDKMLNNLMYYDNKDVLQKGYEESLAKIQEDKEEEPVKQQQMRHIVKKRYNG